MLDWTPVDVPASLPHQLGALLLLALPIACVAWTVTHEEAFRELRDWCKASSQRARSPWTRKFFYLFTCEYCFSHYVTALALVITQYQLLYAGWRGFALAQFALVWLANTLMSVHNRLRLDIKFESTTIAVEQEKLTSPPPSS